MVLLKYNGNPFFCLFSDPLWSSSNECRENYSTTLSFSVQCWTDVWTSQGVCSISELVIPKCIHPAGKRVSVLYYTSRENEIWVQNIIAGKGEFRDVFHVIISCAFTGCLVPFSLHLLHNDESKSRNHKRPKNCSFFSRWSLYLSVPWVAEAFSLVRRGASSQGEGACHCKDCNRINSNDRVLAWRAEGRVLDSLKRTAST